MNSLNITVGEREQRVLNAAVWGFVLTVSKFFASGLDKEHYWVSIETGQIVAEILGVTPTTGNAVLAEIRDMVWNDLCNGIDPFDPDYDLDALALVQRAADKAVTVHSLASDPKIKIKFL